jgi:hypothetical protein
MRSSSWNNFRIAENKVDRHNGILATNGRKRRLFPIARYLPFSHLHYSRLNCNRRRFRPIVFAVERRQTAAQGVTK